VGRTAGVLFVLLCVSWYWHEACAVGHTAGVLFVLCVLAGTGMRLAQWGAQQVCCLFFVC
jgi:hypothetical protein